MSRHLVHIKGMFFTSYDFSLKKIGTAMLERNSNIRPSDGLRCHGCVKKSCNDVVQLSHLVLNQFSCVGDIPS